MWGEDAEVENENLKSFVSFSLCFSPVEPSFMYVCKGSELFSVNQIQLGEKLEDRKKNFTEKSI